jgi:hypothetical protein
MRGGNGVEIVNVCVVVGYIFERFVAPFDDTFAHMDILYTYLRHV